MLANTLTVTPNGEKLKLAKGKDGEIYLERRTISTILIFNFHLKMDLITLPSTSLGRYITNMKCS